jgi:hypothetical protein
VNSHSSTTREKLLFLELPQPTRFFTNPTLELASCEARFSVVDTGTRKRRMTDRLGNICDVSDLPETTISLEANVRGTPFENNFLTEPMSSLNVITEEGRPNALFLMVYKGSVNFTFSKVDNPAYKEAYKIFWETDEVLHLER